MRNGVARSHPRPPSPTGAVQSVDRAMAVLELLARHGTLGVTELAAEIGVHKSTVSRLVSTLEGRDLVTPDRTGRLQLGPGLMRLAGAAGARLDVVQEARPAARLLATRTQETVNLVVLGRDAALYVDQVVAPGAASPNYNWVGQHAPLHATSNGKMLLCELSDAELVGLVGEPARFTPRTVTDLDALRADLALARSRGYTVVTDELDVGLTAVAAPVRNLHGVICASLSVSGPTYRMGEERVAEILPLLLEAAEDVSARMGWRQVDTAPA
ncbi:IclR family transcriptional regulator [Ornithinimicrobium avium]|uniref:IclR family transcriptional regulator n=1 Tax=Ornithinimicrobium avium TaxID=2283195 RepID=A0A345NR00_9MICO|nr:IclR family transcriptional regulator [Ornithinimicrobium avium]AXH97458.1 IclR family transcriptional regulator [Ornithinimicrobium avium]